MARSLRIQFPGAVYHVVNRGNARHAIFRDARDRVGFLRILGDSLKDFNAILHAYCLMDNHYHLLIETPEGNLATVMRQINSVYTQWFNHRHRRVGHLFQGRYGSTLVERDAYLLVVNRYIVMNPVRAGIVAKPSMWRWSSCRATAGLERVPEWLTVDAVLGALEGATPASRRGKYRVFIEKTDDKTPEMSGAGIPQVWGSRSFVERLRSRVRNAADAREYPRRERFVGRPSLEDIFRGKRTKADRDAAIWRAFRACGYSQTKIGECVGLSVARVSRILKAQKAKGKT